MLAIATFNASNRGHQIRPLFFFAISSVLIAYFDCKINTFLSIKYAKTEKVTLQRHGKLYTTIYYSGSINHSGTVKKLDSQAQITCHHLSLCHPIGGKMFHFPPTRFILSLPSSFLQYRLPCERCCYQCDDPAGRSRFRGRSASGS